jgi:hypothetical protein
MAGSRTRWHDAALTRSRIDVHGTSRSIDAEVDDFAKVHAGVIVRLA